jgi:hypothetical protein
MIIILSSIEFPICFNMGARIIPIKIDPPTQILADNR